MPTVRPKFLGRPLNQIDPGSLLFLTSHEGRAIPPAWAMRVKYAAAELHGFVFLSGDRRGHGEVVTVLNTELLTAIGNFSFVPDLETLDVRRSTPGEMLLLPQGAQLHVEVPTQHGRGIGLLNPETGLISLAQGIPAAAPTVQWFVIDNELERLIFRPTRT